jgi:hypothetical protein
MVRLIIAVAALTSRRVLDGVPKNLISLPGLLPRPSTLVLGKVPPSIMKTWTHALPVVLRHSRSRRFLLLSPPEGVIVSPISRQISRVFSLTYTQSDERVFSPCSTDDSTDITIFSCDTPSNPLTTYFFLERLLIFLLHIMAMRLETGVFGV